MRVLVTFCYKIVLIFFVNGFDPPFQVNHIYKRRISQDYVLNSGCLSAPGHENWEYESFKEKRVHLLENSADDAGNAGEEETAREEWFSPDDVHHQKNQNVRRDLWEH